MQPLRLGVNIDHVATIRQARLGNEPDPLKAALAAVLSGASSIVCHLREDRRHIQDSDVRRLKQTIKVPLNLEMSIAGDIVEVALQIRPSQVTLVPERRCELTTEGGLDVVRLSRKLGALIEKFHARGINVSLFIDPIKRQLLAARTLGARIIELHTGRYANVRLQSARERELSSLKRASSLGREMGFCVAAGHGLDYKNVLPVVQIPEIEELNIGFSIISRSLFFGLEKAVIEMAALLKRN